jgi:hypothetical protein
MLYSTNTWFITCAIFAICEATSTPHADQCANQAENCVTNSGQKSSALLQVAKKVHADVSRASAVSRDEPTGATASLDDAGFKSVKKLCCAKEMITFISREIALKGLTVCGLGGLPGLAIFYDCPEDKGTYTGLLDDIDNAKFGDCPWLTNSSTCPERDTSCPSFPTATLPPCGGGTTTTTTLAQRGAVVTLPPPSFDTPTDPTAPNPPAPPVVAMAKCCKPKTMFLNTIAANTQTRGVSKVSSVQQFDCEKYPGAIQVLKKKSEDNPLQLTQEEDCYEVKQLNIPTGTYDLLYTLPFSLTSPAFKAINGVAINPKDGIAYGLLRRGKKDPCRLIRFDKDKIEFVATIKDWSIVGTFSSKGDYYYITKGSIYVIRQVAGMDGFSTENPSTGALADFSNDRPISEAGDVTVQDLVAYTGDLEGTGVSSEYILCLDKDNKLLVVKDGETTQNWLLTTTGSTESDGFGAAWNFKGRVYFSGNSGAGVYEVPVATMNVNSGSVLVKKVGDSAATSKNDGMNCMDVESPFPPPPDDGCGTDYEEVSALSDGMCPAGSFRT